MNIQILFCPAQSVAPDGSPLPTAALALTLEEETQYRCAGFMQAEIERYAEDLEELSAPEDDSADGASQDDAEGRPKKGNNGNGNNKKGKGPSRAEPRMSRSKMEREYIFLGVVATFLSAIRAGAVHFRHLATLLAHYGRLGPAFDLCAKVVVDILREEGMYRDNGETVVAVVLQALRDVSRYSIRSRNAALLTTDKMNGSTVAVALRRRRGAYRGPHGRAGQADRVVLRHPRRAARGGAAARRRVRRAGAHQRD